MRRSKKPVAVRVGGGRRGLDVAGYGAFRFAVYGFLGVALEIFFYNLVRNARGVPVLRYLFMFEWRVDPQLHLDAIWDVPARSLYGQCSLWMFLVYGVASFCIEAVYRNFPDAPWAARSLVYGLLIFGWECLSGWLVYWATGLKIWFYADAGAFFEMTSWFILPIWCVTGLIVEYLYRQLMDPDLVRAIETATLAPEHRSAGTPPAG